MVGNAIIIGVDKVNKLHYGFSGATNQAKNSANDIYQFIKCETNIEVTEKDVFIDETSTLGNLKLRFEYYANLSEKEPIFLFVYMVGHGFRMNESKEEFTFFKLFDQMLFENEFKNWIKDFHEDSKLFCVIDSCYSGGFGSDKKSIIKNDFGLINTGENRYNELINYYNNKLKINLSTKEYPEVFMISSVGELNFARIDYDDESFFFSNHFIEHLQENIEAKNYYQEFFNKLQQNLTNVTASRRSIGHIPRKFHYKCEKNYFVNNKPLNI